MHETNFEDLVPDPTGNYAPISRKFINVLIKRGMISIPISPDQDVFLNGLKELWKDESKTLLRFMLADLRKKDRELLINHPRFGKLERFIYNTFVNSDLYQKGRGLKDVQNMVLKNYGVHYPLEDIKKIRFKVYNDRKARKKEEESMQSSEL